MAGSSNDYVPPPQRVLEPPQPGYVVEWQVKLDVNVLGVRIVYAAFPTQFQRDIETAWVRGEASVLFVPDWDVAWHIRLDALTMQRVNCQPAWQHTLPVRRVFVPAGTASDVSESSESSRPVGGT